MRRVIFIKTEYFQALRKMICFVMVTFFSSIPRGGHYHSKSKGDRATHIQKPSEQERFLCPRNNG